MSKVTIISLTVLGAIALSAVAWLLLASPAAETPAPVSGFGIGDNRSVTVTGDSAQTNAQAGVTTTSAQKIFRIADGPVAGSALIELSRPTSTVVRYVKQENGHVFETSLDVPGAVPRALSNTTIPGVVAAHWVEQGNGVILQYLSNEIVKSVYLGFPQATTTVTSTTPRPTKIQFLPDNIRGIAVSPNGARVAYLLRGSNGSVGYSAGADGTGSAQLFSLPLADVLLSWPAAGTLLATTKSSAGTPGIAFSINSTSGAVSPLIYAEGMTATADRSFSRVVYQVLRAGGASPATYARDVASGVDYPLSFDPYPEKCIWGTLATSTLYCAAPLEYVPALYLDLWHLGAASAPDSISAFDLEVGDARILTTPGSEDGGVPSDIMEMTISPLERYLTFVDRGSRTLWGVVLGQ